MVVEKLVATLGHLYVCIRCLIAKFQHDCSQTEGGERGMDGKMLAIQKFTVFVKDLLRSQSGVKFFLDRSLGTLELCLEADFGVVSKSGPISFKRSSCKVLLTKFTEFLLLELLPTERFTFEDGSRNRRGLWNMK